MPSTLKAACVLWLSVTLPNSTFYRYVQCLACRTVLGGYSDGTFRPGNPITRGQLSKIVANAAGFTGTPTAQTFQDVAPGSTYLDFVGRLACVA